MFVDRLVGDGEYIVQAVRPHWISIVRPFASGAVLLGVGLFLLLFPHVLLDTVGSLLGGLSPLRGGHAQLPSASSHSPQNMVSQIAGLMNWAGLGLTAVGAIICAWSWLKRRHTEYAITAISAISAVTATRETRDERRSRARTLLPLAPYKYDQHGEYDADILDDNLTDAPDLPGSPGLLGLRGGHIIRVYGFPRRRTVSVPLQMVQDMVVDQSVLGGVLGFGTIDIMAGNEFKDDMLPYLPDPYSFYNIWRALTNGQMSGQRQVSTRSVLNLSRLDGPGGTAGISEYKTRSRRR